MMAQKLDGRFESRRLLHQLARQVKKSRKHITLATILVGERYDSALYVRLKRQAATEVGIQTKPIHLPENVSQARLIDEIQKLNQNKYIHGILLQLPLPEHLNTDLIVQTIMPTKDVDGFHPDNQTIVPPPIAAVEHFLDMAHPKGKSRAVILGRNSVYTEQLQNRLADRGWKTEILQHHSQAATQQADVLISVLGQGPRITKGQVKRGAIVIDVGIRKLNGKTVGDVDESVWEKAKAVTPVPGGVGPMTVYYVLQNTFTLAKQKK